MRSKYFFNYIFLALLFCGRISFDGGFGQTFSFTFGGSNDCQSVGRGARDPHSKQQGVQSQPEARGRLCQAPAEEGNGAGVVPAEAFGIRCGCRSGSRTGIPSNTLSRSAARSGAQRKRRLYQALNLLPLVVVGLRAVGLVVGVAVEEP